LQRIGNDARANDKVKNIWHYFLPSFLLKTVILSERSESKDLRLQFGSKSTEERFPLKGHDFSRAANAPV
jgi:hypothetical protein